MTSRALALALLVAATGVAHADPKHKPHPKDNPKDPAEIAYQEGRRHYDLREWDDAIASFKESYRLRTDERSLFNIAQAYRLKGDCVEALGFYQTYKRNFPDADGIPAVDKLIHDVEPCARAHAAEPPPKPVTPVPTDGSDDTATDTTTTPEPAPHAKPHARPVREDDDPAPRDDGRSKRIAGIVIGAAGLAGITGGVAYALQARSRNHDVETGMGMFDPMLQAEGRAANRNSVLLFAVGGAALTTGVVLYILGQPHDDAPHVGIVPSRTGGSVVWRASF